MKVRIPVAVNTVGDVRSIYFRDHDDTPLDHPSDEINATIADHDDPEIWDLRGWKFVWVEADIELPVIETVQGVTKAEGVAQGVGK